MGLLSRASHSTRFALPTFLALLAAVPLFAPSYYVYLLALIFITALLATSLNIGLGYGGVLQMHHAVFYGLGAYTVAVTFTRTELPMWLGLVSGPIVAAIAALFIGWFCVRLRGLYFGMLTLALGQFIWAIIYRWYAVTGGDNGIHGVPMPKGLDSLLGSYYFSLVVSVVCLVLIHRLVHSPFGITLQATRDNPVRSESIGVNLRLHRLIAFTISGFFAGVAGVLFVVLEHSVSPALLSWIRSTEIMIMCLLGGMTTFFGPTLGATVMVVLSTLIGVQTDYWLLVLGVILLVLVLFMPTGVLGYTESKLAAVFRSGRGRAYHAEG